MRNFNKLASRSLLLIPILLGCSKNDPLPGKVVDNSVIKTSNGVIKISSGGTTCSIIGPDTVYGSSATTQTYYYTNNRGLPKNIVWSSENVNPSGSISITSNGASATISFSSDFVVGNISAEGLTGADTICCSCSSGQLVTRIPDK